MSFASKANYKRFLDLCPHFEKAVVDDGIILIKIWLEVSKEEQERRFLARINDPLRQWKLSPMDLESYKYWDEISKVADMMVKATDSKHAPWYILRSDDKRRARLNCVAHILSLIPHKTIRRKKAKLPKRARTKDTPICPPCAGGILCRSGTKKQVSAGAQLLIGPSYIYTGRALRYIIFSV